MNRPDEIRRIIVLKRQAAKLILQSAKEKITQIFDDIEDLKLELDGYAQTGPDQDTTAERRI